MWFAPLVVGTCLAGAPSVDDHLTTAGAVDAQVARNRILVLGDSHATTSFGRALDLLLRSLDDAEVTTVGSCGVSPEAFFDGRDARCGFLSIESGAPGAPDWNVVAKKVAPTPRVDELLARAQPDLTIVELGANQINSAWRDPIAAGVQVRALADAIHDAGSRCLWVGPPGGRAQVKPPQKIDRVYEVLADALRDRCTLLDSRPAALPFLDYERIAPRRGDGRHWDKIGPEGQTVAGRWALEVFRAARRELSRERPTRTAAVVVPPPVAKTTTAPPLLDVRDGVDPY